MKRIDNFTLETKILPSLAVRLAPFSSQYKMALTAGNVGPIYRFGYALPPPGVKKTNTNLVLVFRVKMAIAAPIIMKSM